MFYTDSAKPGKNRKSRLAVHVRGINLSLLVLVLIIMMFIAAVIIRGINENTALDLVRSGSVEVAQEFYSYISEELTLMRKASYSRAVTGWCADEEDSGKKALAFIEMTDYISIRPDTRLFLGIGESGNEYAVEQTSAFADFAPFDRLSPDVRDDAWYFNCLDSVNEYDLNIDYNALDNTLRLFINHKVGREKNPLGVLSSALALPDIFRHLGGRNDSGKIRGYVIDRYGIIRMEGAGRGETGNHIHEEGENPDFSAAIHSYLENISGFFGPQSEPVIIKSGRESYKYAAIVPIIQTDWSVVMIYDNYLLPGIGNLFLLLFALFVLLLLYVLARNVFLNRLIFVPLERLIRYVSEGVPDEADYFGKDRDDEIGDLARTIHDTTLERKRQEQLLHAVNSTAALLLAPQNEEDFESSLMEGMELMGRCVDVDRVNIWRNEMTPDGLSYTLQYDWVHGSVRKGKANPLNTRFLYSASPDWEGRFSRGEYVNGPLSALSRNEQIFLAPFEVKSILIIPVHLEEKFWGFVCFDDCRRERVFTEEEINILRSGSLMAVSAQNRNMQAKLLREVHERTQTLLDSMPLGCTLFKSDYTAFDCNAEVVKLFGMKDKQDYVSYFDDLSPKYQPNGELSSARVNEFVQKAFREGMVVFEWMHRLPDGTPLPAEITLVRVRLGDEDFVAGYSRDLREHLRMLEEINLRDRNIQATALKLKDALREAQNASSAKTDFLANMSHEMRTPLNAIIGLSELSLGSAEPEGENAVNLEKIYNAGMTLLSMVNDILDISKIEAGKFELAPVEYELPSMLNDTITTCMLRIGEKPVSFLLDINGNLPSRLYGDDLRIRQIFNNLLSNAFKYTNEGTVELGVSCERESETVWMNIRVKDTGRGIRSEDLGDLFNDYAQMDIKNNRKLEGTGLGLPITKRIVAMMNGSIDVESEYGRGSVFTVRIPQKYVTDGVIGSEIADSLINFSYSDIRRKTYFRMSRINLDYARVLVVDDVLTNLDVARGMMKPYGMQVDCVTSGQQAIDVIRNGKVRYNAVFMDHMMPGMDGIEATRIIREEIGTDYARTIPIIALTANAIVGNEAMFLSKGFQAFISKPIEIGRLDAVLRERVRNRDLEKKQGDAEGNGQTVPESPGRPEMNYPVFGSNIPGLDIKKGMERFGGDGKSYMQILRTFVKSTRPILEQAGNVSRDNLADYAIVVHGLKGSSRGISAEMIGTAAEALEKAAKEGNYDFVIANNGAFVKDANDLINALEDALRQTETGEAKPGKDTPDSKELSRLCAACEVYDMNDVDAAMEEIEKYVYESESDNELVAWLRKNVDQLDFSLIVERLAPMTR